MKRAWRVALGATLAVGLGALIAMRLADVAVPLEHRAAEAKDRGRYTDAEALLRKELHARENQPGESVEVARLLNNLAELLRLQNRVDDAVAHAKRALEIVQSALGPDREETASCLNTLGELYRLQKRYDEAELMLDSALAIRLKLFGPNHPDVAVTASNIGLVQADQGNYRDAAQLIERALAIDENAFGPVHPTVAIDLANLAAVRLATGRAEEAKQLLQKAVVINRRSGNTTLAEQLEARVVSIEAALLGPR